MAHLLFAVNRWELKKEIEDRINTGQNVILDRYSYSGIAYSHAKGLDYNWCRNTEIGLPEPDTVFYL